MEQSYVAMNTVGKEKYRKLFYNWIILKRILKISFNACSSGGSRFETFLKDNLPSGSINNGYMYINIGFI